MSETAQRTYRGLVYETHSPSTFRVHAHQRNRRPEHRLAPGLAQKGQRIEDLRAIPWGSHGRNAG